MHSLKRLTRIPAFLTNDVNRDFCILLGLWRTVVCVSAWAVSKSLAATAGQPSPYTRPPVCPSGSTSALNPAHVWAEHCVTVRTLDGHGPSLRLLLAVVPSDPLRRRIVISLLLSSPASTAASSYQTSLGTELPGMTSPSTPVVRLGPTSSLTPTPPGLRKSYPPHSRSRDISTPLSASLSRCC
jgi:hypothetical protein